MVELSSILNNIELIIGLGGAVIGIALPVLDAFGKKRAVGVAEAMIEAINRLDSVIGKEGQRKVKQTVRRTSLEHLVDKDVAAAVKRAEAKA